ncbi:MAG: hypothetical protein V4592_01060 [Bacteroidota bacterium]
MKIKLTFLIAIIAIMATSLGCKKTNCCTLSQETNTIVALKNNAEWRTTGYLYKYYSHKDTVALAGSMGEENLSVVVKKSGSAYILIDATFYIVEGGDMVMADYVLDTSKNNTFATTAVTDDLMEGKFELYFKINHSDPPGKYPSTAVFKNGLFRVRWDNVSHVVLP